MNLIELTRKAGLLELTGCTGLLELTVPIILVEFTGCMGLRTSKQMFIRVNKTQRFIRINSGNINRTHQFTRINRKHKFARINRAYSNETAAGEYLQNLQNEAATVELKINSDKTKILLVNYQFSNQLPAFLENLEIVEDFK